MWTQRGGENMSQITVYMTMAYDRLEHLASKGESVTFTAWICSLFGRVLEGSNIYIQKVQCTSFKSPLNRLVCSKWRQHTLSGRALYSGWLVIFHFMCPEPSQILSGSMHHFIFTVLMCHCISCELLLAIMYSLLLPTETWTHVVIR